MTLLAALLAAALCQAPPAVIIDETKVVRQEPPPHNGTGMSTAYRISDAAPGRNFEFRKRVMHKGAAIGLHVLKHDEVCYVLSGRGEVTSDGVTTPMEAGMAAYLYEGADVGIRQIGDEELVLIIAYPLKERVKP
ncbi:cupin domain-containing protein [Caulobacter sp. SLTY]|uniref:cupin domain-containing protein n=1 Tax=Caulobacter sp. SLTY TaxID=2683262 RepID=UPI00141332FE|nr:cupin domain-containing protein [Caulobacter sp. SLTY]NBB15671.1 cupin domain-containing protein [Caulobacter sp. SLTY]